MDEGKRGINIGRLVLLLVLIAAFFYILSILFSTTSSLSLVYFLFGILAIFSALIYIQIHLFYPERKPPVLEKYPSLAILIPNHNSAKTIGECIKSITEMEYPRKFEVYFVDDGSTDDSVNLVKEYMKENKDRLKGRINFKLVTNEKNIGKAASLNKAMRMTDAEVVSCIDSDTYPKRDVLLKMVPYLYMKKEVVAVTGFIVVANPKNLVQRVQEMEYYGAFGFAPKMMVNINGIMVIPGPMSIMKKKEVMEAGGFDENNLTEDMEIGLRLHKHNYIIDYCPDATIPTEVPDTLMKLYRQRLRWYRGTIFNLDKYKSMMFNPFYKDFGMFSYPSCLFYVVFTILTFAILVYYLLRDLAFKLQILLWGVSAYSMRYFDYMDFGSMPVMFNSSFLVFFLVFMALWFYYMGSSIRQARAKLGLKHLPAILFVIVIYPTLISAFYILSFINEFLGSGRKW